MSIRFILLATMLVPLCSLQLGLRAQTIDVADERMIRYESVLLMRNYGRAARLGSGTSALLQLFDNESSEVYVDWPLDCDICNITNQKLQRGVSISDYASFPKLQQFPFDFYRYHFSIVEISAPTINGSRGQIRVVFAKEIGGLASCKVGAKKIYLPFESENIERATIYFKVEDGRFSDFRIAKIEGLETDYVPFNGLMVMREGNDAFTPLLNTNVPTQSGKTLRTNSVGYVEQYSRQAAVRYQWQSPWESLGENPLSSVGACHGGMDVWAISKWQTRIYAGWTMHSTLGLKGRGGSDLGPKWAGLDSRSFTLGYQRFVGNSEGGKPVLGARVSYGKIGWHASWSAVEYSGLSIDPDGDEYLRRVGFNDVIESGSFDGLSIEGSLGWAFPIFARIPQLLMELGLNGGFLVPTNLEISTRSQIEISGRYEQYFDAVLDANGIYDFGSFVSTHAEASQLDDYGFVGSFYGDLSFRVSDGLAFHLVGGLSQWQLGVEEQQTQLGSGPDDFVHLHELTEGLSGSNLFLNLKLSLIR